MAPSTKAIGKMTDSTVEEDCLGQKGMSMRENLKMAKWKAKAN